MKTTTAFAIGDTPVDLFIPALPPCSCWLCKARRAFVRWWPCAGTARPITVFIDAKATHEIVSSPTERK